MIRGPRSLVGRLALYVSLGLGLIWLIAVLATAVALRWEQDEVLDQTLRESARIFLPVLVRDFRLREDAGASLPLILDLDPAPGARAGDGADEALIYQLIDRQGRVVVRSSDLPDDVFPTGDRQQGFRRTDRYVFYTMGPEAGGFVIQFGDPLKERAESFRESFMAFLVPMLALLPLAYLLVGWIARTALQPLERLEAAIAARHGGQLDPIGTAAQPRELATITASLNTFMDRLARSLDNERSFATNAAHELRTPVASALAQAQRLRAETTEPRHLERILEVERALKRLAGLVTRLLQLARAEAGIGASQDRHDLRYLLDLAVEEYRRDPVRAARLRVVVPQGAVEAPIDPDAFAILVGNLIDNAFLHGSDEGDVVVTLDENGGLSVMNHGAVIPAEVLAGLTRRFNRERKGAEGFGIGLTISEALARQAGGRLSLHSPAIGYSDGFEARVVPGSSRNPAVS